MSNKAREVLSRTPIGTVRFEEDHKFLGDDTIDKLLSALAAAGLKVVGREPTVLMQSVGGYQLEVCKNNNCRKASAHVWEQMWDEVELRGPKDLTKKENEQ